MVDSHLMLLAAKPRVRFAATKVRGSEAQGPCDPAASWHLVAVAREADCEQGGTTKGKGHDYPKTPAIYRSRRKPFLSGSAAARHRRFPAHDRAAVRRPREIDPRARRGHEERRPDHAGDAEERVGR